MRSLIYKDEVLDTLQTCLDTDVIPYGKGENYIRYEQAVYEINKLQNKNELFGFSEQLERKKGVWIPQNHNKTNGMVSTAVYYYPKCSVCGQYANYTNFCPNCGADMREEKKNDKF